MVLLTNSLMGAVPALSLDNRPFNYDSTLAAVLNKTLFNKRRAAMAYDETRLRGGR